MPKTQIRIWPLYIIAALDISSLIYAWNFFDAIRQYKILMTIITQALAVILILIWLITISGLEWKKRRNYFVISVAVLVTFFTLFEINGYSGDLLPTLSFRWTQSELLQIESIGQSIQSDTTQVHRNYPQFLGENRDAVIQNIRLNTDWKNNPPQLLWKQPVGKGWSSFAVQGPYAVTQEQQDELETVVCYQLTTGRLIWRHTDKAKLEYDVSLGGHGPRATPTISGDKVYTIGATGILNCLDLKTGERYWSRNIIEENKADILDWGYSCSPLVVDSMVVAAVGGTSNTSVISYNKRNGQIIWQAGNDRRAYSSPQMSQILGMPQILVFTDKNIVAHSQQDGQIFWEFLWSGGNTQKVAQPLVIDGKYIFASTSYGVGSKFFEIKKTDNGFAPELIWESKRMKAKFTNVVHRNGYIYGLDDGILACLDLKNGKRVWKRGRYGHGQLLLIDDILLISTERGEIALVKAQPDAFEEVALFKAIEGKTWNTPAFPSPYLLIRNSEEAACVKLTLDNNS